MTKTKILLILTVVGLSLVWQASHCFPEDIPFGINNPYDQYAPKEKAYLIKPYMNNLGIQQLNDNVFRRKVEPKAGVYDWKEPDFLARDIYKDLDIIFNINPRTNWYTKGSIKISKNIYIPGGDIDSESFKVYKDFLKQLIQRYKGKVHQWMICNEPVLEYKDKTEDYVKLLKISYLTIKEIDPQATVYLGGVTPSILSKKFLNNILPLLSSENPVFGKENAKNNNYFDGFDLHFFGFYDEYRYIRTKGKRIIFVAEFLNLFKKHGLLEGKIITSRAGGTYTGGDLKEYKGRSLKYQNEEQQAGYLVRRAIYLLSKGVRSFWSQIREREQWEESANNLTCNQGLVYNSMPKSYKYDKGDGVKKLSYWTYKFLVEKIKETDWKNITVLHEGTISDHLYLYKIVKRNGQPLYIAWWDYFDEKKPGKTKSITIDVGNVESVKITEAIPNAEWGKDLKESGYPSFFKTETKKASNGKVSLDLGEKPVFVEIEGKTQS